MAWALATAALATASLGAQIDKLAFMAGCWAGPFGDQLNQEMWLRPTAGTQTTDTQTTDTMMGVARNVKGTQTTFTEFMLIKEEKGALGVTVQSNLAGEAVHFPVKSLTATEVVFENPMHNFPRRITYRASGKNRLFARIEGVADGRVTSEEFPMKRVSCK